MDIFESVNKINEMKDEPIVSITKVIDDSSGITGGDEFECSFHGLYSEEYQLDPVARKRLADELRSVADMIEKDDK